MKPETILDAMEDAYEMVDWTTTKETKRDRQYHAFRARILRLDAVGKSINADLITEIEMLNARIAELEAEVDIRDKALDDSQVDLEMWRE